MGTTIKDVTLAKDAVSVFLPELHAKYLLTYGQDKNDYTYCMTEYLRLSGIYWALTAMDLMNQKDKMNESEIMDYVLSCQKESGGFSPAPLHDSSIIYTLSAVQVACTYNKVNEINQEKVVDYIKSLQQDDGSFFGDEWGEVDTRFSFCAIATLALLGKLHNDVINIEKARDFICSCMNFDGGFGCRPGSESHSGQIYCCLGTLSLLGELHRVDSDLLGWWLCERQLPSGGLNGRPEKLPDVCYSWWVLSSLAMIGKLNWIDNEKLKKYILASQDDETGGIADRPGDMVDPFHTLFGITGMSLLGCDGLKKVNPVFCMSQDIIDKLKIRVQLM